MSSFPKHKSKEFQALCSNWRCVVPNNYNCSKNESLATVRVLFILETLYQDGGIVSNGGVLFILETLSHDGGIVSNGGELFKGRLLLHMEFCCSK